MKRMKLYIGITCMLLLTSSCNNTLDTTPTNILTDATVWSSKEAIDAYLGTLYDQMQVDDIDYTVGTEAQYPSQLTDEAIRSYSWGSANNELIPEGVFGWWGYSQVRNANSFIERVKNATALSAEDRKAYEAEARFCRAMDYFAMVKRYGGIPLITVEQEYDDTNLDELQMPRNQEYEIYDYIRSECEAIAEMLPEARSANEQYRVTRYAVYALECRAMLYAASIAKYGNVQLDGLIGISSDKANGYWQAAKSAAEKIINSGKYSLYSVKSDKTENFQNIFLDKSSTNTEQIFTKAFDTTDKGGTFDFYNAPQSFKIDYGCVTNPTADFVEEYEYTDGSEGTLKVKDASGEAIKYDSPVDLFKDKDPRMLATVLYPFCDWQNGKVEIRKGIIRPDGTVVTASSLNDKFDGTSTTIAGKDGILTTTDVTKTGFYIKKFMNPTTQVDWGKSDTNWMVFRYAEILLNYAEACIELGNVADALVAINQIRERAGIATRANVDLEQVRHERKMELAFENHRWWDIRRWRIADQLLNAKKFMALNPYLVWENSKDVSEMKYIFKIEEAPKNSRTFLPKLYYERIPADAISTNPNIVQNPGY